MLSLDYYGLSLLFLILLSGVSCEKLSPVKTEEFSSEGSTVTLSYNYSKAADYNDNFFWYRQYPGKPPEFLMYISGLNITRSADSLKSETRYFTQLSGENRGVNLQISSAAVTDSAVYYCALSRAQGANKLYFGGGTKLTVETEEDYEPSYYKLTNENTMSCLATGFSRHNALSSNSLNWSEVVRISGDSLYNSVVLFPHGDNGEKCPENKDEPLVCVEQLKKGPTVNTVSLIVLGLRLLFIKTVIFNVLMTLRLWISQ